MTKERRVKFLFKIGERVMTTALLNRGGAVEFRREGPASSQVCAYAPKPDGEPGDFEAYRLRYAGGNYWTCDEVGDMPEPLTVLNFSRAYLVYQAGIANVFKVRAHTLVPKGRNAARLLQADFRACENYARGLRDAGVVVRTAGCNMAGDIAEQVWTDELDSLPFSGSFEPVV
jgi:hypothetical protein